MSFDVRLRLNPYCSFCESELELENIDELEGEISFNVKPHVCQITNFNIQILQKEQEKIWHINNLDLIQGEFFDSA